MQKYEGQLIATGLKFGIVISRYNDFITAKLLEGALDCLNRHGCSEKDISIVWVPGVFEIASAAKLMAQSKKYDALIISERSLITKGNYIERLIAYDKWVIDKGRNIKEIFNTACPRFFDKKILKNIKWPKNLSIFDDTILYDRILQNGGRVGYMGSASIRHHEVTSWQVLVKKFFRYGKGYLKAFREYPPGIAAHSLPRVSYFRKDAFKQPKYFFGLFLLYLVKALAASAGVFSNLLDEKVLEKR